MNQERIFTVLKGPHVSEKATIASDKNNQYVFKVASDATKPEIKAAVEALFEVSVSKVNVLNMKGKTKRTARGMGKRNDVRKAYVTVAEGQEISFVAGE
jgi:large subunit ribosomal protein L23